MRIKGKKSYYLYQQKFLEIRSKSKPQNINKSIKNNGKQKHDLTRLTWMMDDSDDGMKFVCG